LNDMFSQALSEATMVRVKNEVRHSLTDLPHTGAVREAADCEIARLA